MQNFQDTFQSRKQSFISAFRSLLDYTFKELYSTAVQEDLLAESFIQLDNEVITTVSVLTTEEIPSSVLAGDNTIDDGRITAGEIDFEIDGPKRPSWG